MIVFWWVGNYQQSDVRIEPGMAGWVARMLPLCYAVPRLRNLAMALSLGPSFGLYLIHKDFFKVIICRQLSNNGIAQIVFLAALERQKRRENLNLKRQ